uniref:Uncharacterized protein n=1 Tax=Fagus sylvatica TaxID=28930 RepID=A0A2N9EEU5_FAGSY
MATQCHPLRRSRPLERSKYKPRQASYSPPPSTPSPSPSGSYYHLAILNNTSFSKEVPDSWELEEYFRRGEKLLLCAIQRRNISTSLVSVTTPVIIAVAVTPMKKQIISLNQCEYVTLTSSITGKEIQTLDFFVSGISYGVPCIGVVKKEKGEGIRSVCPK